MSAQGSRTKVTYQKESTWGVNPAGTAGSQEVSFTSAKTGTDSSGLANDTTVYEATIAVDGGSAQQISIVGKEAQTLADVVAEINKDLTGASAAVSGGSIVVTSNSLGSSSAIAITDDDLFSSLTDYDAVETDVDGTGTGSANFVALPFLSFGVNLSKDAFNDDTVRSDRRRQYNVHGNKTVSGDISVNFSAAVYDDLLESALHSEWSTDTLTDGTTEVSFTVEQGSLDIDQYRLFTGVKVNQMSLTVPTDGLVTASFSVLGKDMTISGSTQDSSTADASVAKPFFHAGGTFEVDDVAVGNISSIEISLDNEGQTNYALGNTAGRDISVGFTTVTGSMSVYFEDASYFEDFINENTAKLDFTITDGSNSYQFTFPKIKYNGTETTVEGQGPILLTVPFVALSDDGGPVIQIDRTLA